MTVLSWGNSDGIKGRCDARCHNARTAHCGCMCGGRYHGTATRGELLQVYSQHAPEILAAAERRAAAEGWRVIEGGQFATRLRRERRRYLLHHEQLGLPR